MSELFIELFSEDIPPKLQIDARLKEIKNRPNEVFGGVAILILGNMLQLKPVKGRYIFDTPISDRWITGHILRPLWKLFSPK